jgi:hypothetical protein
LSTSQADGEAHPYGCERMDWSGFIGSWEILGDCGNGT